MILGLHQLTVLGWLSISISTLESHLWNEKLT